MDPSTTAAPVPNPACAARPGRLICVWLSAFAVTADPLTAFGQSASGEPEAFVQQQRAIQQRISAEFDAELAEAQRVAFDWGGWYSLHLLVFDDGVESSRTLRRNDLRIWTRAALENGVHEFYFRGRASLLDFNAGDGYDRDDDVEGPNLERGAYRLNLSRAMAGREGRGSPFDTTITLGRDLVVFGTGLSLAAPLDHVAVRAAQGQYAFTGVAGRTVGSLDDFDLTRPADRTRRAVYGTQLTYHGFERHRPFAYVLWQRDQNSYSTLPLGQDFDYDSFYFGTGSEGEVSDNLRYALELAYEAGRGANSGAFAAHNEIEAFAADLELEYLFPGEHRARASIEYLFGSGDSDRGFSPTDTLGGNRGDHADNGFVALGYKDTGLALAPRYANLHMWRVGVSGFPWPNDARLGRLELGADWYLFHKHHRDGAISDPTADNRSGFAGWEMDYFANWRVTSDLAWTARCGAFFPGDAFGDQSARTFLLLGVVWSF